MRRGGGTLLRWIARHGELGSKVQTAGVTTTSIMHVDHHPLITEFPEYREKIHNLKSSSLHFANLAAQYEEVDKHICRAEDSPEGHSEGHMHELKAKRLFLKDELYKELVKGA